MSRRLFTRSLHLQRLNRRVEIGRAGQASMAATGRGGRLSLGAGALTERDYPRPPSRRPCWGQRHHHRNPRSNLGRRPIDEWISPRRVLPIGPQVPLLQQWRRTWRLRTTRKRPFGSCDHGADGPVALAAAINSANRRCLPTLPMEAEWTTTCDPPADRSNPVRTGLTRRWRFQRLSPGGCRRG